MDQAVTQSSTAPWTENEFVQKTLGTFAGQLQGDLMSRWQNIAHYACIRNGIESPFEAAFLAAWEMYEIASAGHSTEMRVYLKTQVPVGSYRLDFQIMLSGDSRGVYHGRFPKLCIELDGHDFHEKTKEQVASRNERDRFLITRGWQVIRFSGSEFYRDPLGCVISAWVIADAAVGALIIADSRAEDARRAKAKA